MKALHQIDLSTFADHAHHMSNCVACTDCRSAMSSLRFCDSELLPLLLLPLPRRAPLSGGGVADEPDRGAGAGAAGGAGAGAGAAGGGGAGAGAGAVSASILETAASSAPERSPPSNAPLVLAFVAATSVPPAVAAAAFFLRKGGALLPRLGASGFAGGGERRARSTRGDDLSTVSTCPTPRPANAQIRGQAIHNPAQLKSMCKFKLAQMKNLPIRVSALSEGTAWSRGREG